MHLMNKHKFAISTMSDNKLGEMINLYYYTFN